MSGLEALLAGRVLVDRYRIEEVIGRGGMGAVYRATDERLGRAVAVKVITVTGTADPAARERIRARFRHEAASAARLPHHPNVVPVYDYGTDPTLGLDFIVMELLRGEDLATRLATSGPPPLPAALEILHQAARGLAVGHRAGVIHRDIKPGNIFLVRTDDPEEMQVRVLDFGIAKMVTDEDTFTQLTQDGRAPLSPNYASPEQLRGEAKLTPASDVFSLGAVAFQLLSGERPFSESDRNRMGIGLSVPVPSLRARNPAVPPGVEETVARALAYYPAERFPHAGAFAEALDRARRSMGEGPLPPYAPPGYMPPAEDRTQLDDDRTLVTPVAGGFPRPAGGTPAATRPVPPRHEPVHEAPRGLPWFWITLAILVVAGAAFAWWLQTQRGTVATRPLDDLPDSIPADSQVVVVDTPTVVDAAVANEEGLRFLNRGDYATALEQFRRAVETDPDNAEYRDNLGFALFRLGRNDEAVEQIQGALRIDPGRTVAYSHLADAQLARGDTTAAVAALERYIELSTYEPGRQAAAERIRALTTPEIPVDSVPADTVAQDTIVIPANARPPRRPRDTIIIPALERR
ncbi:MAG TPA: protein kinase [Longimicrobiaceae bacterium]|nr:protein kinase [Longimicrobiaceae bacterium]